MNKKIYSIYDVKAEFYSTPWYSDNDETAQREFTRVVQDPQSAINAFPSDYSLFFIGEFYSDTGSIFSNGETEPKLILDGSSVPLDK